MQTSRDINFTTQKTAYLQKQYKRNMKLEGFAMCRNDE